MKRFTALILLVVLVFSLFACGEEQKAEKYCWNCGEGITKEASFCEHCGTKLNETQNESSEPVENEKSSSVESSDEVSKIEESQSDEISKEETQENTESSEIESSAELEESDEPEQPVHTHSYSKKVTEPTCTEKGYTTYTCSCGDTYTGDETKAKEHIYSKKVTEPTCTEKGYTTYTCSCGDTYKDAETKAKGHSWDSWVTITAPDIGKTGEEKRICSTCKTSEKRQIPALQEDTTKIWFVTQYNIAEQQYINKLNNDKTTKQDEIQTLKDDASALYVSYMQEVKNIKERYPNSGTRDAMLQNAQQNYTNAAQAYTKQIDDLELEIASIEAEIEKPNVDNILSIVTENCKITSKETYEYYYKYSSELS